VRRKPSPACEAALADFLEERKQSFCCFKANVNGAHLRFEVAETINRRHDNPYDSRFSSLIDAGARGEV